MSHVDYDSIDLLTFLTSDTFQTLFKASDTDMLSFLAQHVDMLTRIALRIEDCSQEASFAALLCLTTKSPVLTTELVTNPKFLFNTFELVKTAEQTFYRMCAFCKIVEFLVESSSGFVFMLFPAKLEFMVFLLDHMNYTVVVNLLEGLVSNVSLAQFLGSVKATELITKRLHKDTEEVLRLLDSLCNAHFTSVILMQPLLREGTYTDLLQMCLNSDNMAAVLLLSLVRKKYDYRLKESRRFMDFMVSKVKELVEFICSTPDYNLGKSCCVRIIITLAEEGVEVDKSCVVKMFHWLFELMLLLEGCSILHNDVNDLFQFHELCLDKDQQYIETADRISVIMQERDKHPHATYWQVLYQMSAVIMQSNRKMSEQWTKYIEEIWNPIHTLLTETKPPTC